MRKFRIASGAAVVGAALLIGAAGCGGAGASGGGFSITVKWPTSKAIPALTQSLVIVVAGSGVNQQQTLVAPTNGAQTTTAQFAGLPVGDLLVVQCYAYGASVGGVTPLLGIADQYVTLASGSTNAVTLDLVSSIDHLAVTGAGLQSGTVTLAPGASTSLTVAAYSTNVDVVPIAPGNLSFTSTGTGFTLTPNGNTVTVIAGTEMATGMITATEKESGKSVTINVVVS